MKISSLSIKIQIGFEDIIEALAENGKLKLLGYNIDFPIKEPDFSIVNIYSEDEKTTKENLNIIRETLEDINYSYDIKELDSENYMSAYMEYLKPFKIDALTIVPNLKEASNENIKEPVIYIGKQYAFGTGTHETTYLALKAINQYIINSHNKGEKIENKTAADIGCGSGILSLTLYKFGIKNITSLDNDESAVSCTLDNAKYNSIPLKKVFLGSADTLAQECLQYDLVVANIETDILIEIMPHLVKLLKNDSFLILSGIFIEKKEDMIFSIKKHNLKIVSKEEGKEWMSLTCAL